VFDLPLVSLPDEIELQNEKEEQMLINNQKEVKYHVTNKNYLTGTSYNAPGVLVKFEAEGGEISSEYDYTDAQGNVSVMYTPKSGEKSGVVKAEVVLGAEPEKEEDAMKADDYAIEAIDYRLTGGSYTIPEGETSVEVTFQLEKYSSKTATWAGEQGRTVSFEATNGTVSPSSGVTDSNGKVTVTFAVGDNFSEGSVTASASGSDPSSWSKTAAATIKAEGSGGDEGITDEGLKKAKGLDDNTYVIEEITMPLGENDDIYYFYKKDNEEVKVIAIEYCREHPQHSSVGGGAIHVTPDMVGKEIDLLTDDGGGLAWMNIWTLQDPNQGYDSDTNPEINYNTSSAEKKALLEVAKCKVTQNSDGSYTTLSYMKTKDGKEAYSKITATTIPSWAE
jgi:hypothetical protein